MTKIEIPGMKLESLANVREHWSARSRRAKSQRYTACLLVPAYRLPCVVTITRIGPRALDSDNLAISAKHIRDGVADKLGVPDNDPRIEWRYAQRHGRDYGVEIVLGVDAADDAAHHARATGPV